MLALVRRVREACTAAGEDDPLDEAAVLALEHRGLDGVRAWTPSTDPGAPAGQGFALRRGTELDLAVAPPDRGTGLGAHLAAQALAEPGPLTAWSHGDHPAARALAQRHGLARARELWVMRRPASEALPAVEVPDGLTVRGFTAEPGTQADADRDAVLAVNAAAFAHHPEQGALDAGGFAERTAEPWWDPAGLILALDDEGLAGFHWTKQHSPQLGEVYVVGIAPRAQGRGLGRLLTLAGLHHLHERGVDEVHLYVESDNDAAVHTYSRLGFTHAATDTHVQYRRA